MLGKVQQAGAELGQAQYRLGLELLRLILILLYGLVCFIWTFSVLFQVGLGLGWVGEMKNKANSVQFKMKLPVRTELGNIRGKNVNNQILTDYNCLINFVKVGLSALCPDLQIVKSVSVILS